MITWDKMNRGMVPNEDDICGFVRNPVFEELYHYIIDTYQVDPQFEYSGCVWPGWNIKFKKAGKNLCTIYPFEGYLGVLVVIGTKEKVQFKAELPSMSKYLQNLYEDTEEGMGQRWLRIELEDRSRMQDVKQCIAIKRGLRKL